MLSEYRQRFGDLHTELQRDAYLLRSGQKSHSERGAILRESSDLFELEKVRALQLALEETAAHRETARASLRRLIAFALEGRVAARVREVTEEIEQYESQARLNWDGRQLGVMEAGRLLAVEADAARRRDLHARRADLIRGANDLRAERLARMQEAAGALQYDSQLAMRRELGGPVVGPVVGMNAGKLAEAAGKLLSKTESRHAASLASLLPREIGLSMDDAAEADLPRLHSFTRFDVFFSPERMPGFYHALFADLGFHTGDQSNVELDSAPRPGKHADAFCATIRIPDEVKLVFTARGGQANYRELLREAGHAQHAAWTSRNLDPEFRTGGDPAVPQAWGLLFENLPLDAHWLMSAFGFVENAAFRHTLGVFRLLAVRQAAAILIYECEFHAGSLAGHAGRRFAELMTDTLRMRFDETDHLLVLDDAFHAADVLRACAFESQMREYLKTKFGERWWASRKAGEMLIDLWNLGQRHSVEELAAMIGLGELDFDWLSANL